MAKLIFFDEGHRYELDGEELPSVSELTRFLSREIYGDVMQFNLDRAAERGTKIHKLTEALDKYGSIECPEDLQPYLMAYVQFLKDYKPEWKYIERSFYHPDKLYAGTIDRYGTMSGKKALVDIKTVEQIKKPLYAAGLNLYRRMLPDPVETQYILQLRKNGTYKLHSFPIEDGVASACITLHQALKKKPRKKKGDSVRG